MIQSEGVSCSTFSSHYTFGTEADPPCSVSGDSPHEVGLFGQTAHMIKSNETLENTDRFFSVSRNTTVHKQEPVTSTKYISSAFTAGLHVQTNILKVGFLTQRVFTGSSRCATIKFLSIEQLFSGSPQIIFNGSGECSKASTSQHPGLQTSTKSNGSSSYTTAVHCVLPVRFASV